VTIPSSEPQLGIANILDDPSEVTNKDGNVSDEVHHIGMIVHVLVLKLRYTCFVIDI